MKQLTLTTILCLITILSSCSGKPSLAPSNIYDKEIEFFVLKAPEAQSDRHKEKFIYRFLENNSYKVTTGGSVISAGSFSYRVRKNNSSRIVCTYSTNNVLASYEIILVFKTPNSGTWESSYNASEMGSEAGTFIILKRKSK